MRTELHCNCNKLSETDQWFEVKIPSFEIDQDTSISISSPNDIVIPDSAIMTAKDEDIHYGISSRFETLKGIFQNCTCDHNECTCSCDRCAKHDENHYYDLGRYKLLNYIVNCIKFAPIDGKYNNPENILMLKEAGHLFHKHDGMDGMITAYTEEFITDRYYYPIDREWDGIGEWSCGYLYS